MKKYMYKCVGTSAYNVKTLYLCTDKEKLKSFIEEYHTEKDGYTTTEITQSRSYYCTDGNADIHCISLS